MTDPVGRGAGAGPDRDIRAPPSRAFRPENRLSSAPTMNRESARASPRRRRSRPGRGGRGRAARARPPRGREGPDRRAPRRAEVVGVQAELPRARAASAFSGSRGCGARARLLHRHAARVVNERELLRLLVRVARSLALLADLALVELRCDRTDTHSPAAIEKAPASRPATPVSTIEGVASAPTTPR